MKVTIWKDRMGSLHIFKGYNRKLKTEKYLAKDTQGNEADLFVQFQSDIEAVTDELSADKKDSLNNGYQVNHKLDDLHFNQFLNH